MIRKCTNKNNLAIYICVFLACMVPRIIPTFKIELGINISYYSLIVLIIWLIKIHKVKIDYNQLTNSTFFLVWIIVIVVNLTRTNNFAIYLYYVSWLVTTFLFQQIVLFWADERTWHSTFRAFTDALFVHLIIGTVEIVNRTHFFEISDARKIEEGIPISIFYNQNDYAIFVVCVLPIAIYMLFDVKPLTSKAYYLFIIFLSITTLLFCESRASFLAIGFMLAALLYGFQLKHKRNAVLILVESIGVFSIMVLFIIRLKKVTILFSKLSYFTSSNTIRVNLIKNGIEFLRETRGTGVGPGNLALWLGNNSKHNIYNVTFMHNWYMEVLVTFGAAFFVLYCIWHIGIFRSLIKSIKKDESLWNENTAMFLSFATYSIACISSSSNVFSEWVWMYLSLMTSYCIKRYSNINKE